MGPAHKAWRREGTSNYQRASARDASKNGRDAFSRAQARTDAHRATRKRAASRSLVEPAGNSGPERERRPSGTRRGASSASRVSQSARTSTAIPARKADRRRPSGNTPGTCGRCRSGGAPRAGRARDAARSFRMPAGCRWPRHSASDAISWNICDTPAPPAGNGCAGSPSQTRSCTTGRIKTRACAAPSVIPARRARSGKVLSRSRARTASAARAGSKNKRISAKPAGA